MLDFQRKHDPSHALYWKNDKIFKEMLDDVAKRYGKDDFLKTLEHINKIVEVIKDTMDN